MAPGTLPSQDYLQQCFDYDPETGVLRWKKRPREHFTTVANFVRWQTYRGGTEAGVIRGDSGYHQINMGGKSVMAHRIIWKMVTGEEPISIDHRNLIKSDNRWTNLRPATLSENSQNRTAAQRIRVSGTLKGAYWNKKEGIWKATIMVNGNRIYLGRFATEAEAHARYCEEASRVHGEFANFN